MDVSDEGFDLIRVRDIAGAARLAVFYTRDSICIDIYRDYGEARSIVWLDKVLLVLLSFTSIPPYKNPPAAKCFSSPRKVEEHDC